MFKGKTVLITGGTGSLGTALTQKLLKMKVGKIRIFSRDEWKQTNMKSQFPDKRLRFLIGDIRDGERLNRAMENVDIVFHTAALKQVPVAEYNPFEFIKTNVNGTQNVIDACLDNDVQLAIGIGTDKAVSHHSEYIILSWLTSKWEAMKVKPENFPDKMFVDWVRVFQK